MNEYYIYLTDTFCGELNYSYISRFIVKANSVHGALCKMAKETGLNFKNEFGEIYFSKSGLTALVIESEGTEIEFLEETYSNATII